MKCVIASMTLALAMLATTEPAKAQELVRAGSPVSKSVGQNEHHCYALITTPGSQWRITLTGTMDTYLEVGRGSCDGLTVDAVNDDTSGFWNSSTNSQLTIAAGGGAYIVRVAGYAGTAGSYSLSVQSLAGVATRGLLAPGGQMGPWFTAGWTPLSVSASPANAGEGLRPGTVFKDCEDVCPELVVIPAGAFTMGSPPEEDGRSAAEGPRHPVAFAQAFAMGRREVSFAEYDACVADGGCSHRPNDQGWGRERRPVVDVSWNDAQAYVAWLSKKTGQSYALPSESEWEYAARAGANTRWQTGNAILTDDANILNAFGRTVPTGSYPPNRFGLHDVHGNVSEWVLDCMDTGYLGAPNDGGAATSGNCPEMRVNRGGNHVSEPNGARFAYRARAPQTTRLDRLGFRVARAL